MSEEGVTDPAKGIELPLPAGGVLRDAKVALPFVYLGVGLSRSSAESFRSQFILAGSRESLISQPSSYKMTRSNSCNGEGATEQSAKALADETSEIDALELEAALHSPKFFGGTKRGPEPSESISSKSLSDDLSSAPNNEDSNEQFVSREEYQHLFHHVLLTNALPLAEFHQHLHVETLGEEGAKDLNASAVSEGAAAEIFDADSAIEENSDSPEGQEKQELAVVAPLMKSFVKPSSERLQELAPIPNRELKRRNGALASESLNSFSPSSSQGLSSSLIEQVEVLLADLGSSVGQQSVALESELELPEQEEECAVDIAAVEEVTSEAPLDATADSTQQSREEDSLHTLSDPTTQVHDAGAVGEESLESEHLEILESLDTFLDVSDVESEDSDAVSSNQGDGEEASEEQPFFLLDETQLELSSENDPSEEEEGDNDSFHFEFSFIQDSSSAEVADEESSQEPRALEESVGMEPSDREALQDLYHASRWSELEKLAEQGLSGATESTCRLYWIVAQLKLGSVPLSILSAPLDRFAEIVEQDGIATLDFSSDEVQVLEKLFVDFSERFREEESYEDVIALLRAASTINPSHEATLLDALEFRCKELSEIPSYRLAEADAIYLEELKLERTALRKRVRGAKTSPRPDTEERSADREPRQGLKMPEKFRSWVRISAAALGVFLGIYILQDRDFALSKIESLLPVESAEQLQLSILPVESAPLLMEPKVETFEGPGAIGALLYEMTSDRRLDNPASERRAAPRAAAPQRKVSKPFKKFQLNLSEPKEPKEVSQMLENARQRRTRRPAEPKFYDREFVRSGGLSTSVVERKPAASGKSRMYEVIASASVTSGPSSSSRRLVELQEGAVVEVVSEDGEWYRIRSEQGKYGYIHKSKVRLDLDNDEA